MSWVAAKGTRMEKMSHVFIFETEVDSRRGLLMRTVVDATSRVHSGYAQTMQPRAEHAF